MKISSLIDSFRIRPNLMVEEDAERWIIEIRKGSIRCVVTIPKNVFEWFVLVSDAKEGKEIWSDWMDHYDDSDEHLEIEMSDRIAGFVERGLISNLTSPIPLWEEKSNQPPQAAGPRG